MSKRYIFPQEYGERKKLKLDGNTSHHKFSHSQNIAKENELDNWGDDDEDEMLLRISQVCERACNSDNSILPNYSFCMQPSSTSTQYQAGASTSREPATFKKPNNNIPAAISVNLKDKCRKIASPLPGISKETLKALYNIPDDLIFNDRIYKDQDSERVYCQLLQLQEENAKLKLENGKLLDKCVMKEGEASILRTQLKTSQMAVDSARLEKVKAQEKIQMEWMEKINSANKEIHDLRTKLDFTNVEIISIKEKCRMLESSKVKFTKVVVANNDISMSHKLNNNIYTQNDFVLPKTRAVKMISNSVQTEDKAKFLKLNKKLRTETSKLNILLPVILEPTAEQLQIIDYNGKLQKQTDRHKITIYSTLHRLPSTPTCNKEGKGGVCMTSLYADLICIITGNRQLQDKFYNLISTLKTVLSDVCSELDAITRRITAAFQREMDERCIEATSTFFVVNSRELLCGTSLYKEEQAVLARRTTAVAALVLESPTNVNIFINIEEQNIQRDVTLRTNVQFIDLLYRICNLIDCTSTATLYSGLLYSITILMDNILSYAPTFNNKQMTEVIKCIITSRAAPFVACQSLRILRRLALTADFNSTFCPGNCSGNLRTDYDQGVLMFKKDSCYILILMKQIECSLKCIERKHLTEQAVNTTQDLIDLYTNMNIEYSSKTADKSRCDCQLVMIQVLVYALRICSIMLKSMNEASQQSSPSRELLSVCRSGVQILYQCSSRDVELNTHLSYNEGHLIEVCEVLKGGVYDTMLSELTGTFQSSTEDIPHSLHEQVWVDSFNTFTITD